MKQRHALPVTLAVLLASASTIGLAHAATSRAEPRGYAACANADRRLALLARGVCPAGTHRVSLGARGPAGARGPRGAKGAPGAPGPAGVRTVYTRTLTSANPVEQNVLTLPAGSYEVRWDAQAKVQATVAADLYTGMANCLIRPYPLVGAGGVLAAGEARGQAAQTNANGGMKTYTFNATIPTVAVITLSKTSAVTAYCDLTMTDPGTGSVLSTVSSWKGPITATTVDEVVRQ